MYCKSCGAELKGNEKFCPECGKTVILTDTPKVTQNSESKPKDSKRTAAIVLGIVVLLALIAAIVLCGYFVSKHKNKAKVA